MMREIDAGDIDAERFHREVVSAYQPAVLRGLVKHWPATAAGRQGPEALSAYLRRFAGRDPVTVKRASPDVNGRFFYDGDITGCNYRREKMGIVDALDILLSLASQKSPASFSIQSFSMRHFFPGFDRDNPAPMLPDTVSPRAWLGNACIVPAHYDTSENIACCVAGRRRFTLFPPDRVADLYPGPFEFTPTGPTVSMVDFDAPDFDRYPRFSDAMAAALVVDLEPGDALYVPYLWWHHVRSIEPVNMLVNYWWKPFVGAHGFATEAMLLAMTAIKGLPADRREAWRAQFDHYVFEDNGPPGVHLPIERRGVQGEIDSKDAAALRTSIARKLAPQLEEPPRLLSNLRRAARVLSRWRRAIP